MKLNAKQRLLAIADDKSATQAFGYLEKAEELVGRVEKIIGSAARVHAEPAMDRLKKQAEEFGKAIDSTMEHLDSTYDI